MTAGQYALPEDPVFRTIPDLPERIVVKIAHNMSGILIETAGNNFTVPGNNRIKPESCTPVRQWISGLCILRYRIISSVFFIFRKPFLKVAAVYYLHRLEAQGGFHFAGKPANLGHLLFIYPVDKKLDLELN